jgi:hypothetical protein
MACTDRNPLNREGTSQLNRVLAALDVHYADVDERNSADFILFAKRYAAYLNYYNESNAIDGTWQPLMMMDVSVTLATLANINVKRISDYKKLLYKNIALAGNSVQPLRDNRAKQQLKFLFDTLFSLVKIIDDQLNLLPDEEYKKTIEDIIKIRLKLNLANLEAKFFQDFTSAGLLDYNVTELDSNAPFEITSDKNFTRTQLSTVWQSAVSDLSITIPALSSDYEKIFYIINHNLFNSTIDSLLKGVASFASRAKELFEKTLVDFPNHTPHYGLFLTFTRLFKVVQDDLNHYTQRHLDFYFKDVLQLKNKNPLPDTAHLTFELQKPVQQQLLTKGILFKGGKDITGKEISYSLSEDVVLNKATVSKIHTQHIDLANHKPLKVFPVANSEDGEGANLTSADKSWFTFGNPKSKKTAKTGFAIATNVLFLNEGTRVIVVSVTFENSITGLNVKSKKRKKLSCFEASLTGKKDWLNKNVLTVYDGPNNRLLFGISITPNDPAIVQYSEKIHKLNFETNLPLLTIYLDQDAADAIPYSILCKQKIAKVDVSVNVSGVKDLVLSSDVGSIDASKPFKPFGDFPAQDAGFIIGSKEIFQKKISELTFSFTGTNPFSSSTFYLDEAKWKTFTNLTAKTISGIDIQPIDIDFTPNENLKATTLNGFIKLTNSLDKSITFYMKSIKKSLDGTILDLVDVAKPLQYKMTFGQPAAPEEIKISDFSVGYKATSSIDFTKQQSETDNNLFYHLTPFGYAEVFNDGTPANTQAEKTENFTLLADLIHNGELFVGFVNAEPDTVLSVLFQVADGSSNPLKNMVPLSWFYLTNNEWIQFENRNVIDRTNNFTQSGIVTFTLPAEISNQNTLLEKGKHWIKAVVENDIDAVCNLILIQAQSAKVELVQDEAAQIEFRQTIPAKTISKLIENIPAVKTITQPFDSFNGRTRESDEHYYVRVSERLRHKQRAITIWDYEHILLEQFPQLYKVKCLNHSGFYDDKGTNVFCENLPGHVTIVPVPDLKNNTHANLLKPYTPIGLINNINEYLKKITSPFAKLHINKPQFEEVRLEFEVQFHDNLDVSFYTQLLNEEIEKFLCPWAYSTEVEIPFGSKISKSVLLNFVEERPYVDFVTCFELHHLLRDGETVLFEKHDIEEAVATTSRSVLVSYFDESNGNRHIIHSPATCTC